MVGTHQTDEELNHICDLILTGYAKLVGNTADGSYHLEVYEKDEVDSLRVVNPLKKYSDLKKYVKQLEKERDECNKLYLDLCSWLMGEEEIEDSNKLIILNSDRIEYDSKSELYHNEDGIDMIKSFIETQKFEENYGFLEPDGTFHPVDWCNHQEWAHETALSRYEEEYTSWNSGKSDMLKAGDFLVEQKGWVLINNPSRYLGKVQKSQTKSLTKAQREFLYNYYTEREEYQMAFMYLEDGE